MLADVRRARRLFGKRIAMEVFACRWRGCFCHRKLAASMPRNVIRRMG
jgi:hypothetical protein